MKSTQVKPRAESQSLTNFIIIINLHYEYLSSVSFKSFFKQIRGNKCLFIRSVIQEQIGHLKKKQDLPKVMKGTTLTPTVYDKIFESKYRFY